MLINHRKKQLLFTPFKNFSTSINNFLTRTDRSWQMCLGPHPGDPTHIGGHTNFAPMSSEGYRKYLLIRNPYDRVLSMWGYSNKLMNKDETFFDYLQVNLIRPELGPVTVAFEYDHLIHVENIHNELVALTDCKDEFPHKNKGEYKHELTDLEKEFIYFVHRFDFINGEYDK